MEWEKTDWSGITDEVLINLFLEHPEIDSRVEFFVRGISPDRFPDRVQEKFRQQIIAFKRGTDTVTIISGLDRDSDVNSISIGEEDRDLYDACVNPYELLEEDR